MKISASYFAQIRIAAGVETETIEVRDGSDISAAIKAAVEKHCDAFRQLVLAQNAGLNPNLIILLNGQPAPRGAGEVLKDGDSLSLFSPVAGG